MRKLVEWTRNLFGIEPIVLDEHQKAYNEWSRLRSQAMSPSERHEIDAIFSRSL
jgi:cell division protein FtsL